MTALRFPTAAATLTTLAVLVAMAFAGPAGAAPSHSKAAEATTVQATTSQASRSRCARGWRLRRVKGRYVCKRVRRRVPAPAPAPSPAPAPTPAPAPAPTPAPAVPNPYREGQTCSPRSTDHIQWGFACIHVYNQRFPIGGPYGGYYEIPVYVLIASS
jgi:hypothetical protein